MMKLRLSFAAIILIALLAVCSVGTARSIIFPGLDTPLVSEDSIFAHHTYGKKLICLDKKTGTVRWQVSTAAPIHRIFRVDSKRIIAVHKNGASLIGIKRGNLIKTLDISGFLFGRLVNGNIFIDTKDETIVCQELETGKKVWQYQYKGPDSTVIPLLVNDLVFLSFRPRSISHYWVGESERFTMKGTNMIACLSAKNGAVLWREVVPLSNEGFGLWLHVRTGQKWLLGATDNDVRLLDRKSGKVIHRWHSKEDIDGADFWGNKHIVVCIEGIDTDTETIRIMSVPNFALTSEFTVNAMEVALVEVVGDVLILQSLYSNIGVDLRLKKVIWQKGQRHYTVQDGLLYYGEHHDDKRVLGICNPKTGKDTIIYSEEVKMPQSSNNRPLLATGGDDYPPVKENIVSRSDIQYLTVLMGPGGKEVEVIQAMANGGIISINRIRHHKSTGNTESDDGWLPQDVYVEMWKKVNGLPSLPAITRQEQHKAKKSGKYCRLSWSCIGFIRDMVCDTTQMPAELADVVRELNNLCDKYIKAKNEATQEK